MMTPSFYLKNPKAEQSLIYMGIKLHGKQLFKYYTEYKIYPELFDKSTKRPTVDKALINSYKEFDSSLKPKLKEINKYLNIFEQNTEQALRELLSENGIVTKEELKAKLDSIYKPKVNSNGKSNLFINYVDEFIKGICSGEITHNSKKYEKGTIKTYYTFRNVIAEYNNKLTFDLINMDFYNHFVNYLNGRNYSLNSVGKNIKFIKVIMRNAYEKGLHDNLEFTYKDFKAVTEKVDDVYLTKDELQLLYDLDLSDKPNYELARDVFLVGCYTALRFGDYSKIKRDYINSKGFLEMHTEKTNTKVVIPLNSIAKCILNKYDYTFPKTYEQKVNKYIKEVCKIAGIVTPVWITKTIGGKVEKYSKPKNELIKTHSARRTGATLMYLAGIRTIEIMKITGHSREQNFMRYIKISNEEVADRLSENPFFQ